MGLDKKENISIVKETIESISFVRVCVCVCVCVSIQAQKHIHASDKMAIII